MALGTLDRTPPPFFRQGPSSLTKLSFCSALAVFLMVADARFSITQPIRATVATMLYPLQRALLVPVEAITGGREYAAGLAHAVAAEQSARQSWRASRSRRSAPTSCSAKTRACARCSSCGRRSTCARRRPRCSTRPPTRIRARSSSTAASPTTCMLGSPVVNEAGVLGQVTRVYLQSSEVTLLTDRDAAIPVLNSRTQVRSAAFGGATGGAGLLEMRFMAGNADVQVGDVLTTSGVDGVYPPGLKVASVAKIDRKIDSGFARIVLAPAAPSDGMRHVLVLEPTGARLPPRPQAAASEPAAASKAAAKKGGRK